MPPGVPTHVVTSDASGSWGCGALTDAGQWFQVQWPESWARINIAAKEMVPVVISVAIWGQEWARQQVLVRSDNMAVVYALTAGTARDPLLMHLLRCLHFFIAKHQIGIEARHVAGIHNTAADALSRNKTKVFFDSTPQACREAARVPSFLLDILLHQRPDWLSPTWRTLFLSSWARH